MSDSRHDPDPSPLAADPRLRKHRAEDQEAQEHPEGNARERIEEPRVGLPVESGDLDESGDLGDGGDLSDRANEGDVPK